MAENLGQFDVVVIGGGPGGYVAAIRAGQLGLTTAVIEKDPKPGGTCLHRGCIPTKAMLQTAHILDAASEGKSYGVKIENAELDMPGMHKYKDKVVKKNAGGVEYLLKKNKVTLINGYASLESKTKISVELAKGGQGTVEAKNIILATGSVAARPGFLDWSSPRIITSDEALKIAEVPKHITVLGAGAVGCEFASIFKSYGAETVLLVEMMDRLLPVEDKDCSAELAKAYRKRKIDCRVSTKLESAKPGDDGVEITLSADGKNETFKTDILLCAVGRWPFTEKLGLDKVGVKLDDRGFVIADDDRRTNVPNIYAIGDIVTNTPQLAHAASAEGIMAVEIIAGQNPPRIDALKVPNATYCDPEVASVGLTEDAAREAGHEVKASKFPFSALGKGGIVNASTGFFKIVSEAKYGEILGVHVIGPHATDLIAEGCAAIGLEATAGDLAHIIHAHPTLAEGMMEAAHGLTGGAIHI